MEKRKHPRKNKNNEVKFIIDGKTIICMMENLSESGALLKVKNNKKDKISHDDIGKEATIEFNDPDCKKSRGRIIRVIEEGDINYFAVFFLKQ